MEWKAMDTAPKDVSVLVFVPGRGVMLGYQHMYTSAGYQWTSNWTPIDGATPTHWMPLPEPPK